MLPRGILHELVISIHAPRVGATERSFIRAGYDEFQSTPPVWGATPPGRCLWASASISIHAPRVGGDTHTHPTSWGETDFNPRPPCGGRL